MAVIKRKSSLCLLILMLNALNVHANDYREPVKPVTFNVNNWCNRAVDHRHHTFQLGLTPYKGGMLTPIASGATKVVFFDHSSSNSGYVSVNMPCYTQQQCNAWVPPWDTAYRFQMNVDKIIIDESHIPEHIKSQMYEKGNGGRDSTVELIISNGQRCTATYSGGLTPPPVKPPIVHLTSSTNTIDFGTIIVGSERRTINSTINISVSNSPLPSGGNIQLTMNNQSMQKCGMYLSSQPLYNLWNGSKLPIGAIDVNKTKLINISWHVDPRAGTPVARQCSETVYFTLTLP